MSCIIEFREDFDCDFQGLDDRVQEEVLAKLIVLEKKGPNLGWPHADTLNGFAHSTMKELRVSAAGVFGASPLLLTPGATRSFWRPATSVAPMRTGLIVT